MAQAQYKRSPDVLHRQPSPRLPSQYTPPMEDSMMFSHGFEREGSKTPPLFAYHAYPAPEDIMYPPYPQQPQYRPHASAGSDQYGDYLGAPVAVTLPSMVHIHEAIKREDDTMSPFNMSYPGLPAIDIHASHSYDDANPHVRRPRRSSGAAAASNRFLQTPPLSHSYEHSSTCSESGYQYPSTPLSMPPSPRLLTQI